MRFGRAKPTQFTPANGVFAAAITPRRSDEIEADIAALFELLDFLSQREVRGVVLYGSTGEFVHYTLAERARVTGLAVKRSRVPIFVNVSHSTLEGTLFLAEAAASAGVAGMFATPPHYFRYADEDVEAYFLALAGATAKLAPLYLYNIPLFTSAISPSTAARLLKTGLFAGIKDSSGDWAGFESLAAARAECTFELYVGNDRIFARSRQAGADGVVSGVASALPELLVAMDRAIMAAQSERVEGLNARLEEFIKRAGQLPGPVGIREAVGLRGINPGPHAAPLGETGQRTLLEFREWFKGWLPTVLQECNNA